MDPRNNIFARLTQAGGRVHVRNALNPVLWLCAIVGGPCFLILGINPDPHPLIAWILGAVVGTALAAFVYLLLTDPDRLHSEDYLIRRQTLDIIEDKATKRAIDASVVPTILSEEFLRLPPTGGNSEANS